MMIRQTVCNGSRVMNAMATRATPSIPRRIGYQVAQTPPARIRRQVSANTSTLTPQRAKLSCWIQPVGPKLSELMAPRQAS
jgi:hypothetical protein